MTTFLDAIINDINYARNHQNGQPDKSYFAPDCFHFSTKGHKEMAVALWNNMVGGAKHMMGGAKHTAPIVI